MPMTILRPDVGPTKNNQPYLHTTYHLNQDVNSYLKTLENNPFHLLSDEKQHKLHKLNLPDGSIAFSIHPTTTDLLHILQSNTHTTNLQYLEQRETPSTANCPNVENRHSNVYMYDDENGSSNLNKNQWLKIKPKQKNKKQTIKCFHSKTTY